MKKMHIFSDIYDDEDIRNIQTFLFIATVIFGVMVYISSSMGIYL